MAHKTYFSFPKIPFYVFLLFFPFVQVHPVAYSQLDYRFYDWSCPRLQMIVRNNVWAAIRNDARIAASLLRLHFHDCIVDGCDSSVLLDDTEDFQGEKNAFPNRNSLRGFDVIDRIKADVENFCVPQTVSCTDILTLAAREAVGLSGGPFWPVLLGRRDGTTASQQSANQQIPFPSDSLKTITAKFTAKGLDLKDVVVLSGAHTIGFAQCFTFKSRLFNFKGSGNPDPSLDPSVLSSLQSTCPNIDSSNTNLAPLDSHSTFRFDNTYYGNVIKKTGLLQSDQALLDDPRAAALVNSYSNNPFLFSRDFAASMVKLVNVGILTGQDGEIREKCGSVNY
ncbi:Peroxidase 10 [Morus notabilis]|uniref:Peroxidase n=1 Tax=Morus notabilis TaxID=981085 RepID=W9SMP6_9ROSA|nr:peroxidase 10 [Morus notabilis]EXC17384.1 Peroxidase 10 [Morus notabilis]